METPIKGFKGFDKDLKCRGFQYEVGKVYETDKATICESGFHFVQNPHDIFRYYYPRDSRFAAVEALAPCQGHAVDSKLCTTKIKINSEINVFNICKIAVSTFFATFKFSDKIKDADTNNAGDWGAANAGDGGAANAGNWGAANAGDRGAANAGDWGAANAGNWGAANAGDGGAANAGNWGAANAGDGGAANAGYRGAANAGDRGAANAGNWGVANAGNRGAASVGKKGVAIVATEGKAKGDIGSILVLVNRDDNGDVVKYIAAHVDGKTIKANIYYKLDNGKLIETD